MARSFDRWHQEVVLWRMRVSGNEDRQRHLDKQREVLTAEMRAAARGSASVLTETVAMVTERMTKQHNRCGIFVMLGFLCFMLCKCICIFSNPLCTPLPGRWLS